jgi:hypothetical protein
MKLMVLACGFFVASSPVYAEGYNLRCVDYRGAEVALLTVRDAVSWIPSPYLTPQIRIANGKVGETSAVDIDSYTDDKIKVRASIKILAISNIEVDEIAQAARFDSMAARQAGYTNEQILNEIDSKYRVQFHLELTVDRNTGVAEFGVAAERHLDPKTGLSYQLILTHSTGVCRRENPRF